MRWVFILFILWFKPSHGKLSPDQILLTAIIIDGREVAEIDAYQQDDLYWLPLDAVAEATGIEWKRLGDQIKIKTPLGEISIPVSALERVDQNFFISSQQLEKNLKIILHFDEGKYAFVLDILWNKEAEKDNKIQINPDIIPSEQYLSFLRYRNRSDYRFGTNSISSQSYLDIGGGIFKGSWQTGWRFDNHQIDFERYFWQRGFEHQAIRLGTNYIDFNELSHAADYTGLQWAYTKRPIIQYMDFEADIYADSFLNEDITHNRDIIRDDGFPGGIAELRLDGNIIQRVRIDLKGHYEFLDIKIRMDTYQKREIYLYPRNLSDEPKIIDLTQFYINKMFDAQDWILRTGIGFKNDDVEEDPLIAFFLFKYGLSKNMTLQGIVQQNNSLEANLSLLMSLGQHWGGEISIAYRKNSAAFWGSLYGSGKKWFSQIRLKYYQDGFYQKEYEYDLYMAYQYYWNDDLSIGLNLRSLKNDQEKKQFILPLFYWRIFEDISVSAYPDIEGEYRSRLNWYINRQSDISITYQKNNYDINYSYKYNKDLFLDFGINYQQATGDHSLYHQLNWYLSPNNYRYLQAGISQSPSGFGYFIAWHQVLMPGIEWRMDYRDNYNHQAIDSETSPYLQAYLQIDLGYTGDQLLPMEQQRINLSRGGIAGYIVDEQGKRLPVEDLKIYINGRLPPQQQVGGIFAVNHLQPGIYEVSLDEENLPIEWVLLKKRYWVEVRPATITQVNFVVSQRYGIAGQIRDEQKRAIAQAHLVLLDEQGQIVQSAWSNEFGYYRMDNLPSGTYSLQLRALGDQELQPPYPQRSIQIKDDYLFQQDMILPPALVNKPLAIE